MKLREYRKSAHDFTKTLSNINRNLAYAGIAIIWVFRQQVNTGFRIPNALLIPLILIILGLLFDLLQYLYSSIIWTRFHRQKEKQYKDQTGEVEIGKAPPWYPIPAYVIFYIKIVLNIAGFIWMAFYIFGRLFC